VPLLSKVRVPDLSSGALALAGSTVTEIDAVPWGVMEKLFFCDDGKENATSLLEARATFEMLQPV
jgi:hypothetical protein